LEAAGHVITYKWWECASFTREQAQFDFEGVISAEAFVLVVEDPTLKYSGSLVEFGIALNRGIPIYIIGTALDQNIFTLLPGVYRGIETLLQAVQPFTGEAYYCRCG
jgi:hypothetical protein